MIVKIKRIQQDKIQTLGDWVIIGDDGKIVYSCKTIELGWNDNKRRISCIPKGTYIVKKRWSKKYGDHFHITDVEGREWILIHAANYSRQLLGCIAVGDAHVDIDKDGLKDVTNSVNTLKALRILLPDEFALEIT